MEWILYTDMTLIGDTNKRPVSVINFFWWELKALPTAASLQLWNKIICCASNSAHSGIFRRGHHLYLLCFDDAATQSMSAQSTLHM